MCAVIERLLIANRGEITVRVARTARRLGITTVGVYSDPDADALHVDSVDLAVALGGESAADSYLRADAVLQAALATGCDAVHPGYGFLAENAGFAQAVLDAGLTWVGPSPEHIMLLGDKVTAKRAAVAAGVPTTEITEAGPQQIPDEVPMPALVKAAAGGGGRDMRIMREKGELPDAIAAASREAKAAFGDGAVFIEPYIEHGRHIEVQIIGDRHGNVVHLGERECSIQRRNQKIIEESPSAAISDATRTSLCDGALALANHVGYENAGTVEFMVGADGTINFLEVNTRLQVEHPVTEAVTGLDLVELQIRVAEGEPLPITQSDIVTSGHSIEVRLVAEDASAGWLPSTGTLSAFEIGGAARVDTGVRPGAEISPNYDSMIAKVITHAGTRSEAARLMERALSTSQIVGVSTNLDALVKIMSEPDFLAAKTPTSYLDDHPGVTAAANLDSADGLAMLLGATFAAADSAPESDTPTRFAPSGWRNVRTQGQRRVLLHNEEPHYVEYVVDNTRASALVGPWPVPLEDGSLPDDDRRNVAVRMLRREDDQMAVEIDGVRHSLSVVVSDLPGGDRSVLVHGRLRSESFVVPATFEIPESTQAGGGPVCPLPGTVIAVHVEVGQTVRDGDLLMVVEAMKMEHKITAAIDAEVTAVHFAAGDRVDQGDLLVSLATESA